MPNAAADEQERPWSVGSAIRVFLPNHHPKVTRRAVIATFDKANAVILWGKEDRYPGVFPSQHKAVVAPMVGKDDQDDEMQVPLDQIMPLLDFEKQGPPPKLAGGGGGRKKLEQSILLRWKDRGDQLLKLGDAAAALSCYEYALYLTFLPESIGTSILVKKKGFVKIAEVDCINDDDDDKTLDVVWNDTQDDGSVPQSQNLLTILDPHNDNIQERILLNLTRCCIQIAEVSSKYRGEYAQAATLAASMAHVLAQHHNHDNNNNNDDDDEKAGAVGSGDYVWTALLLRAQAHATRQKYAHATQDLQRILNDNDGNVVPLQHKQQAQNMLRQVKKAQERAQRVDQILVRQVSKWVDTAMTGGGGGATTARSQDDNDDDEMVLETKQRRSKYDKETNENGQDGSSLWSYFTCSTLE